MQSVIFTPSPYQCTFNVILNSFADTRKRKGASDGSPKAKQLKKDTKKSTAAKIKKTPGKKSVARKTLSRTRSHRSSIAGPSGGGISKPDFTDMINMITLQTFDGSWDLSKNLAAILRKTVDDLTNSIPEPRLVCLRAHLH